MYEEIGPQIILSVCTKRLERISSSPIGVQAKPALVCQIYASTRRNATSMPHLCQYSLEREYATTKSMAGPPATKPAAVPPNLCATKSKKDHQTQEVCVERGPTLMMLVNKVIYKLVESGIEGRTNLLTFCSSAPLGNSPEHLQWIHVHFDRGCLFQNTVANGGYAHWPELSASRARSLTGTWHHWDIVGSSQKGILPRPSLALSSASNPLC